MSHFGGSKHTTSCMIEIDTVDVIDSEIATLLDPPLLFEQSCAVSETTPPTLTNARQWTLLMKKKLIIQRTSG